MSVATFSAVIQSIATRSCSSFALKLLLCYKCLEFKSVVLPDFYFAYIATIFKATLRTEYFIMLVYIFMP